MSYRKTIHILIMLIMLISILSLKAQAYKKIKLFMPQTPEIDLGDAKTIAVLDFKPIDNSSTEAGKSIADKMLEYFLTEDRGIRDINGSLFSKGTEGNTLIDGLSTKCFRVVERSRLEAILDEQSMSDVGFVDDAQAARIGQLLGVDIMLYGEVSDNREDKNGYETRTIDKKKVKVRCTTREVSITASIRIVDTRTGEIIGIKRLTQTQNDKHCSGDFGKLKNDADMAAECANVLAWNFTNLINPWYAYDVFELEKIKLKEFKASADEAAEAAENLELDKAYAIYKNLYESDSYNPKFLYNMGVLYEVTGDFDKAREMYEGAVMLKDEKNYLEAVERIDNRLRLIPFYTNLDMEIIPFDFEAASENESLFAEKVTIKGGSGDRIPIYSDASELSEVQTRVPGGIQLEVIEQQGDWVMVKLLGGKQGFIENENVK
ncbi:MAG: CsgG/HfaB family protein [Candidatus Zixiibacteriota bacterium]